MVNAIEGLADAAPAREAPRVRRIHRQLDDLAPANADDPPTVVRKLVMAQVAKARGRVYIET